MEKSAVLDQMTSSVLQRTGSLLKAHPARITGTEECLGAARGVADLMRRYCDQVIEERFTLHPGSLWSTGKVAAVSYPIAVLFLVPGGYFSLVSLIICGLAALYVGVHYVACGKLFDPLFKKVEGCNVIGRMEPSGPAERQILIAGHHDAPFIFSFLTRFKRLAAIRLLIGVLFFLFLTFMSAVGTVKAFTGAAWPRHGAALVVIAIGLVFVLPIYAFITKTPSPGAGDNLNACSTAVEVARYFSEKRKEGMPLKHTCLIFLSADGEEAGQRGAIAYAAGHKPEMDAIPSYVLNIDSVYKYKDLAFITRDRHGTQPLSKSLAETCGRIASELGYKVQIKPLPPGAGGTDAAAFAKLGIEAVTLLGMSTSMTANDLVYHTENDIVTAIEPEAVKAVLDIVVNYIEFCDGMECKQSRTR